MPSINTKIFWYRDHSNAKSLDRYLALVEKSFPREDAQNISLTLSFLVGFAPPTWLIPRGIAVIKNKKPIILQSATMRIDEDSYPVNNYGLSTKPLTSHHLWFHPIGTAWIKVYPSWMDDMQVPLAETPSQQGTSPASLKYAAPRKTDWFRTRVSLRSRSSLLLGPGAWPPLSIHVAIYARQIILTTGGVWSTRWQHWIWPTRHAIDYSCGHRGALCGDYDYVHFLVLIIILKLNVVPNSSILDNDRRRCWPTCGIIYHRWRKKCTWSPRLHRWMSYTEVMLNSISLPSPSCLQNVSFWPFFERGVPLRIAYRSLYRSSPSVLVPFVA
jgi:hypothetical protein